MKDTLPLILTWDGVIKPIAFVPLFPQFSALSWHIWAIVYVHIWKVSSQLQWHLPNMIVIKNM